SFVDDPIIPDGDPFAWFNGYIWAENAGWISMGQGLGPFGGSFGTGVNILTTGYLEGLAWGENIGWVNFGTRPFIGNDGARYDSMAKRLRGWAWGENVGWINLEDALHGVHFVSSCGADLSGDGFVNGADLANLLASWGPGASAADLTGDGMV